MDNELHQKIVPFLDQSSLLIVRLIIIAIKYEKYTMIQFQVCKSNARFADLTKEFSKEL